VKLRITIDGKTYEAEVEVLDDEAEAGESPFDPAPVAHLSAPIPQSVSPTHEGIDSDALKFCRSPFAGHVIAVNVISGQSVESGDVMIVLEAMKMESPLTASHATTVKRVLVAPGTAVKAHQVLVEFE
jgi:methylmalonyl-CoA carboxyltransferase small subunit